MSTLKVDGIRSNSATSDAITLADNGTCTANITNNLSNRNKIINGGMQIFQRSASVADVGGSNGYFAADRYRFSQSGAARFTISQSTDTPNGFGSSMKVDVTTANASPSAGQYVFFQHRIEGQNVQDFAKGSSDAKQYVLSFHVKSPKTGVHCMELEDVQNSRSCSKSYTVNSANTWEKKTIIFPADTTGAITNDNANRFQLYIWLMAGSTYTSGTLATTWASTASANRAVGQVNLIDNTSNDFFITGIQLEVDQTGSGVATDFEHRSYADEIRLCERYFQTSFEKGQAPTHGLSKFIYKQGRPYSGAVVAGMDHTLRTEMRATPTLVIYTTVNGAHVTPNRVSYFEGSAWLSGSISVHPATNTKSFAFDGTLATGFVLYQFNFTCDAEL